MVLKHSVYDTDTHFSIDSATRMLVNTTSPKNALVQGDHNSERITFELPRYIEGHDMLLCDSVQVHFTNTDLQIKTTSKGVYDVDDLQVSPDSEDVVICSWLISHTATKYVGSLHFLLRFTCKKDTGELTYVWNTAPYTKIVVGDGLYNGDVIEEVLTEDYDRYRLALLECSEELEKAINEATEQAITEALETIAQAEAEAEERLPDAYLDMSVTHYELKPDADGNFYLELGKVYKVYAPKNANLDAFTCELMIGYKNTETGEVKYGSACQGDIEEVTLLSFPATAYDCDDYFTLQIADYGLNVTHKNTRALVRVNGAEGEYWNAHSLLTVPGAELLPENAFYIANATKVLVANDTTTLDFAMKDLEALAGSIPEVTHVLGDNPDAVMSQAAVTRELTALVEKVQMAPAFANSIEECTDTSKLYVLPDGYIYASILRKSEGGEVPNFTNHLHISTDESGEVYNGKGYKEGVTLYYADGQESPDANTCATGFIPIDGSVHSNSNYANGSQIIRFKNIPAPPTSGQVRVMFYKADKSFIGYQIGSDNFDPKPAGSARTEYTVGEDGYISTLDVSGWMYYRRSAGVAFIRICAPSFNEDSVITINEEITYTPVEEETYHEWINTGHAFVPADYEGRIIKTEAAISALNSRVSGIEAGGAADGVKGYVREEAERVANKVYSRQNANTFTFLAISDMHYLSNPVFPYHAQCNIHAGQGMDLVRKSVNIDFATCLGDSGWGGTEDVNNNRATIAKGIAELREANKCIDASFRGIPNFRVLGNHESLMQNYTYNGNDYLDPSKLYPLCGAYNHGATFPDEKDRGYCYRDLDQWKLRVIALNTSDVKDLTPSDSTPDVYVSGTQGRWLAETLDLSSKNDAAEWNILILSHAPLDCGANCIFLCDILKAYIDGGSVSITRDGVTISYNYSGKNAATIIGNCHGHIHNFKVDDLHRLGSGSSTTEAIGIKRFSIPNACFSRNNADGENNRPEIWDIEYGETTTYNKVAETAQDTAFCVVTVDTKARKIYADHYGAGYDREIKY